MLRTTTLLGVVLVVAACNTTAVMKIPEMPEPKYVADGISETRPIAFAKAISGLRSGETIAHFPAQGVKGVNASLCNYKHSGESIIKWTSTERRLSGWSDAVGTVFHDVMSTRGFDLAGDPDQLFNAQDDLSRAELHIRARVEEIRGNLCEEHHWWDGRSLDKYAGEMYMKINWAVYDILNETEVASVQTRGYALKEKAESTGIYDYV